MALKATIYKAELSIADMDRNYYDTHLLTLARHPSETDERMMVRLLAFAIHAHEHLTFTKGLFDTDEPDLVCTKDGVLVARHDAYLNETTDVARRAEFAGRRTRKTIDGQTHEGWFVDDFTLAEIKTLRAIERIPESRPGSAQFDGMFQVVTLEEIIDFVAAQSAAAGRVIGLVPALMVVVPE
eukprot:gene45197-56284_t